MKEKKDYNKLIKALQIAAGVFMLAMVVICIVLIQKYNISLKNISGISEILTGGTLTVALIVILFSVVKSFALVFPPAVVFAVCGYVMPNYWIALLVNVLSVLLSMSIPYLLGRFTGKGMVDALGKKFKAVRKVDAFAGANEIQMTFAVKLSGLLPSDLSSLLFGAMNISFKGFTIGANLGMLPLVIVYTFFGITLKTVGDRPWIVALPVAVIIVFNIIAAALTKRLASKNKAEKELQNKTEGETSV